MKGEFVEVTIERGPMCTLHKQVLAHEVPLIRMKHGNRSVSVLGAATEERDVKRPGAKKKRAIVPITKDIPSAQAEYERLMRLYGVNGEHELARPYVELVYGPPGSGGLTRAIKAGVRGIPSVVEDEDTVAAGNEDSVAKEDEPGASTDETEMPFDAAVARAELADAGIRVDDRASDQEVERIARMAGLCLENNIEIPEGSTVVDLEGLLVEEGRTADAATH